MCIICNEGATPDNKLINNQDTIPHLLLSCNERVSLGETKWKALAERLSGLTELELKSVFYHSECRKPIVNKCFIEKLRNKRRARSESPAQAARGRPSTSTGGYTRPKRTKAAPKAEVCVFSCCTFCSKDTTEPLHQVLTDSVGETLLELKLCTLDNRVRTSVSDLESAGDAAALEKYYHKACLRSAQRTVSPDESKRKHEQLVRCMCDEELLSVVETSMMDEGSSLDMCEVNDAYLTILKCHHLDVRECDNYRKYLKNLISQRLPCVQFVRSVRRNEPDKLVLSSEVTKAIHAQRVLNDKDIIAQMSNIARIIREDAMQYRNWSFDGNFETFG